MVMWVTGPNAGNTTKQSSVSMRFWTALDAPPPSENESEKESDSSDDDDNDDDAEGDKQLEHAAKKARFEAHRRSLVGNSVEVSSRFSMCSHFYRCLTSP